MRNTLRTLFECWVEKGDCKAFKEAQVLDLRFFLFLDGNHLLKDVKYLSYILTLLFVYPYATLAEGISKG